LSNLLDDTPFTFRYYPDPADVAPDRVCAAPSFPGWNMSRAAMLPRVVVLLNSALPRFRTSRAGEIHDEHA
jgi:hypothetical protein